MFQTITIAPQLPSLKRSRISGMILNRGWRPLFTWKFWRGGAYYYGVNGWNFSAPKCASMQRRHRKWSQFLTKRRACHRLHVVAILKTNECKPPKEKDIKNESPFAHFDFSNFHVGEFFFIHTKRSANASWCHQTRWIWSSSVDRRLSKSPT